MRSCRAFRLAGRGFPLPYISSLYGLLSLIIAAFLSSAAFAAPFHCNLLAPAGAGNGPKHAITATDLLALRDFGGMGLYSYPGHPMALSPDGKFLALQLRRADPVSNSYCTGIVVAPTDGRTPAVVVADGGKIQPVTYEKYGIADLMSGAVQPPIIHWSPDGRWLAFTKYESGHVQIWKVAAKGGTPLRLTSSAADIENFEWTRDGNAIVYSSRPGLVEAQAAIEREGRSGYRYDNRFWPLADTRPHPSSSIPRVLNALNLATGRIRPATGQEKSLLDPAFDPQRPAHAVRYIQQGIMRAWLAPAHPDTIGQPNALHLSRGGQDVACPFSVCRDVDDIWWFDGGKTLILLTREGFARSETALYRWTPGKNAPRRLLRTKDALFECQATAALLYCTHEGAVTPRDIIGIDPKNGHIHTVYDPNPQFRAVKTSPARRLHWYNDVGIETFGDLVLPIGYRPGHPLPLIVVQYESRGFLRGGTGDEYPIQLFAAHGFAVLSFNRPAWYALKGSPKDLFGFLRANQEDWADRRSVQSSLEVGIQRLVARGIVDPQRIGITGQSDGASTATFALIHSKLFAAASLSTCCEEPEMMATLGPAFQQWYVKSGYPRLGEDRPGFWSMSSLARNIHRIKPVPLLIQAADQEMRLALQTFEVTKAAGWPVKMYVFPNESHVKVQPAHRLSIYSRNLAFFEKYLGQPRKR